VGFDPRLDGLFWVAGLGGHGMTSSAAVGDLAGHLLLGLPVDENLAEALSPTRFMENK